MCLALYLLLDAWAVFSAGSMAPVSCSGVFSGFFCGLGALVGRPLFGAGSEHLGFVLVRVCLSVLFVFFAWHSYVRSKSFQ